MPKTTNDIQDFEMGKEQTSEQTAENPTINKYAEKSGSAQTADVKPKVDPLAARPQAASASVAGASVSGTGASAGGSSSASGNPTPPTRPSVPSGGNPDARRKALLGCLGAFASVMLILLILAFIFLATSDEETSPIAKLLGINQGVFVNWLITFVHIIFILSALTAFIFTMVGLFKASMAKRGDLVARKAGLRSSLISGITLLVILIIWGFVYIYLDAKRVQIAPTIDDPIVTEPEDTLNLSAPIEIRFDASNVPIDKKNYSIVSHNWDFGDGSTGTSQIVTHLYEEKGIYDVKLEVIVEDKDTNEVLVGAEYHRTVSITNDALAAIFSATPQSGEAPLIVEFDATASSDPDGTISDFEWDLDEDGDFDDAEGEKITRTFDKIGKYTVALRVTSTTGEFDVEEKEIEVVEQVSPEAVITITGDPEIFEAGVSYVFKAEDSTSPNGTIEEYEWDFNDGTSIVTTKTTSHVFSAPGTYEVTLKVVDEKEEEGETTKTIIIATPQGIPEAAIVTDPAMEEDALFLSGKVPFTVSFDASKSTDSDNNIVDYAWDFDGNGTADSFGKTVTHPFSEEGTYNVNLTVTDADDNEGRATLIVKVEAQGIIAYLEADKIEGNVPLTVNFDAGGSTYQNGQITSYRWDFGDGTPSKLGAATISHKYSAIGSFTAEVTVIGSDNTTDTASIIITVREIPLSACFVSVFEEGPAPLETSFDPGCSSGTIKSYFWDFGDGGTSTQARPTYVFQEPGTYTVVLEVADANNTVDQAQLVIEVTE